MDFVYTSDFKWTNNNLLYGYLKNRIKFMMPYTLVQNTNNIFKVLLDGIWK